MHQHRPFRWGVIGTGYAADQFVRGLKRLPNANVVAVASRSQDRSRWFADRHRIDRCYSTYEQLVTDLRVDIVYIATTAPHHHSTSLASIQNGKPTLCEKPFAMSAQEAHEVVEMARRQKVFCMEAMWSRFIPLWSHVRHMVNSQVIGEIVSVAADFGINQSAERNPRLFDPDEGGALRDLGVYPIALAVEYLGMPSQIALHSDVYNGVDERVVGILKFDGGAFATVHADICCQTPTRATIIGTEGYIEVDTPMYRPKRAILTRCKTSPTDSCHSRATLAGGGLASRCRSVASKIKRRILSNHETISVPYFGNGYQYQAVEVMDCLVRGDLESSIMPLDDSIRIMRVVDAGIEQSRTHHAWSASTRCHGDL